MSEIEKEIILSHDSALQAWLGEILSDAELYNSDMFRWCQERKKDLLDRAGRLGLRGAIEQSRQTARAEATTAKVVDLAPFQPNSIPPGVEAA